MRFPATLVAGLLFVIPEPSVGVSTSSGVPYASNGMPQVAQMHMVTPSTGWAVDAISILRTTNGARTWRIVSPRGYIGLIGIKDYQFVSGLDAWITVPGLARRSVWLLDTTDAGRTWHRANLVVAKKGESMPNFAWISFLDAQQGWLSTLNAGMHETIQTLFRTRNGGQHWTAVGTRLPVSQLLGFLTSRVGFGAYDEGGGSPALMYRTVDAGRIWKGERLSLPRGYKRNAVSLQFGNVVSGKDGKATLPAVVLPLTVRQSAFVAFRTNDWGRHWQLGAPLALHSSTNDVSYDFESSSDGWAIKRAGLYATTNSGKTWRRLTSNVKFDVGSQLSFVSRKVGFLLPRLGRYATQTLFKTMNGGRTWTRLHPKTL